ncbi:hypothetical protein EDB80DRAFT_690710 [Ilyonectria destructans]|nr:hypothetical protein EDB80DRAFT_690710 [Ilyonectria destructans]
MGSPWPVVSGPLRIPAAPSSPHHPPITSPGFVTWFVGRRGSGRYRRDLGRRTQWWESYTLSSSPRILSFSLFFCFPGSFGAPHLKALRRTRPGTASVEGDTSAFVSVLELHHVPIISLMPQPASSH